MGLHRKVLCRNVASRLLDLRSVGLRITSWLRLGLGLRLVLSLRLGLRLWLRSWCRLPIGLSTTHWLSLGLCTRHRLAIRLSLRARGWLNRGLHGRRRLPIGLGLRTGNGLHVWLGLRARNGLPVRLRLRAGYWLPIGVGLRAWHWLPLLHRHYRLCGRHRLEATPVVLRCRLSMLRELALHRSRRLNWLTRRVIAGLGHGLRAWLDARLFGLPKCHFCSGRFVGRCTGNGFCFSHLNGF